MFIFTSVRHVVDIRPFFLQAVLAQVLSGQVRMYTPNIKLYWACTCVRLYFSLRSVVFPSELLLFYSYA